MNYAALLVDILKELMQKLMYLLSVAKRRTFNWTSFASIPRCLSGVCKNVQEADRRR